MANLLNLGCGCCGCNPCSGDFLTVTGMRLWGTKATCSTMPYGCPIYCWTDDTTYAFGPVTKAQIKDDPYKCKLCNYSIQGPCVVAPGTNLATSVRIWVAFDFPGLAPKTMYVVVTFTTFYYGNGTPHFFQWVTRRFSAVTTLATCCNAYDEVLSLTQDPHIYGQSASRFVPAIDDITAITTDCSDFAQASLEGGLGLSVGSNATCEAYMPCLPLTLSFQLIGPGGVGDPCATHGGGV